MSELGGVCGVRVVFAAVGHRYGRRRLFEDLSLTLGPGSVTVVQGSNGTGKSTLLRIVAGLLRPALGEVRLEQDGRPLDSAAWRAAVGYVSPDLAPYRALTVAENLEFYAKVRGLPIELGLEAAERVGLTPRLKDQVAELSSGYVQRVRLAVALQHRPDVLLLDEPGVTLDDHGQHQLAEIVSQQREFGVTMLATNDPRDLVYATQVIRLAD